MQDITDEAINQIQALSDQELGANELTKRVDELASAWFEVQKQIVAAQEAAKNANKKLGPRPEKRAGETSKDFADRVAKWEKKSAEIEASRSETINSALASGRKSIGMYMGGKVKGYSYGGKISGTGSRDSVSARLTPGEFVVRKAMVGKYGVPMLNSINQGSFSMPRYNAGRERPTNVTSKTQNNTNLVAPMYNNYSVNVSVSNTASSADEIANRTIMKIKQMQEMQIRGSRGY